MTAPSQALATSPSAPETTAPLCCAASDWLTANPPRADHLPAEIVSELPRIRREAEAALKPGSPQEFAVALEQIWDWARTFNVQVSPQEVERRTAKYRELLGHLPADILAQAILETVENQAYRSIPLPGDIKKRAADEYERRRAILLRARAMAMYAKWTT